MELTQESPARLSVRRRAVLALVGMLAVFGFTVVSSTPAEAATYVNQRYSYCPSGLKSYIWVDTVSWTYINIKAYKLNGTYLGQRSSTTTRLHYNPGYEDVRFVITTGAGLKSAWTGCS